MKTNKGRLAVAVLTGFLLVVLIRGLAGCSSGDAADAEIPLPETADEVVIATNETDGLLTEGIVDLGNAVCPVMGRQVVEGQFLDWEGYRVHFCCAGCDGEFLSDPEHYLGILSEDPSVASKLESACPHCSNYVCTYEVMPSGESSGNSSSCCDPAPYSCGS